jgi:hypothetical protein
VALKSDTAAEKFKDQLSPDFPGRSIFDFCNNISQRPDIIGEVGQVRKVPIPASASMPGFRARPIMCVAVTDI